MSRQATHRSTPRKKSAATKKPRERHWFPDSTPWPEKIAKGKRGTVADVAAILDVPSSFVYTKADTIPGLVRVGKYLRWDLKEVLAWRTNGGGR